MGFGCSGFIVGQEVDEVGRDATDVHWKETMSTFEGLVSGAQCVCGWMGGLHCPAFLPFPHSVSPERGTLCAEEGREGICHLDSRFQSLNPS